MNINTEKLKKKLFGSEKKEDWASRDAWVRRAIFWKLMALGVSVKREDTDDIMSKTLQNGIQADLYNSPPEESLNFMERLCLSRYANKETSEIIVKK